MITEFSSRENLWRTLNLLPGIKPLPECVGVKVQAVGTRLDREGQARVGVGRRLRLVIDVHNFPVRQNFPVPAERQSSGDALLAAGSRVGPLGGAVVPVRVVDVALCKVRSIDALASFGATKKVLSN